MSDPEINAFAREAARVRALPRDAACTECGTRAHLTQARDGAVLCYTHLRTRQGARAVEEDHLAGRANVGGLTVLLNANDHRTVTEMRLRLGIDRWPSADDDPLLALAHLLAGLATLILVVAEWLVDHAAAVARGLNGTVVAARPFPVAR